jgi:hypothetical protein
VPNVGSRHGTLRKQEKMRENNFSVVNNDGVRFLFNCFWREEENSFPFNNPGRLLREWEKGIKGRACENATAEEITALQAWLKDNWRKQVLLMYKQGDACMVLMA